MINAKREDWLSRSLQLKMQSNNICKLEFDGIVYEDKDEWFMWRERERGDPVLHIELRKWADSMLIAPLDANSLAKIANGICDNSVTSLVRAWDLSKPAYFAPALNTYMWDSPLTIGHRNILKTVLQFKVDDQLEMPTILKMQSYEHYMTM